MATRKPATRDPEPAPNKRVAAYNGTIARSGTSEAIRLEKALFRSHTEFQQRAKVQAVVVAPGHLLVSVVSRPEDEAQNAGAESREAAVDPVMTAFLAYLGEDMRRRPDRLRPLTDPELSRIRELVADVKDAGDDEEFPEDVTF